MSISHIQVGDFGPFETFTVPGELRWMGDVLCTINERGLPFVCAAIKKSGDNYVGMQLQAPVALSCATVNGAAYVTIPHTLADDLHRSALLVRLLGKDKKVALTTLLRAVDLHNHFREQVTVPRVSLTHVSRRWTL